MTIAPVRPSAPAYVPARDRTEAPRAERRAGRSLATGDLLAQAAGCPDGLDREELRRQVVELNMGVAEAIASRYRNRGVADEDLTQVAYLALTKAVARFDADAGHDFLSFAVPTIRGEIRRYFRDAGWMVRPPRRVQELQSRIFAARAELLATLGRSPTVSEVAQALGEPREEVEEALTAEGCFSPTSLDRPVGPDSDYTVGDLVGQTESSQGAAEARVVLKPVVRRLSERDRRVIALRFFDECTQQEIAQRIGVTQTQVSRLLNRILGELREGLQDPNPAA